MKKIYIQPETTVVRITQTQLLMASDPKGGGSSLTLDINEKEEAGADEQLSRVFSWDDED